MGNEGEGEWEGLRGMGERVKGKGNREWRC